jgi:hypothetical protein
LRGPRFGRGWQIFVSIANDLATHSYCSRFRGVLSRLDPDNPKGVIMPMAAKKKAKKKATKKVAKKKTAKRKKAKK